MFLFLVQLRIQLVNPRPKVGRVPSESDPHDLQELVHPIDQTHWLISSAFFAGLSFIHDHLVCQISGHDEIMFYYKPCFFGIHNKPSFNNIKYLLITLLVTILYSESKYADGSSKRYTFAGLPNATINATLYSSPPLSFYTSCSIMSFSFIGLQTSVLNWGCM